MDIQALKAAAEQAQKAYEDAIAEARAAHIDNIKSMMAEHGITIADLSKPAEAPKQRLPRLAAGTYRHQDGRVHVEVDGKAGKRPLWAREDGVAFEPAAPLFPPLDAAHQAA